MSAHPLESLSAFLDDELGTAERRDVEAHLAACPSCARHLGELAAVDALARGLPPAGAPDGYLEALPGRVRAAHPRRSSARPRRPGSGRWPPASPSPCSRRSSCCSSGARYSPAAERAANETVPPATPAMTVAPDPPPRRPPTNVRDTRPQAAARTLRRRIRARAARSRAMRSPLPPAAAPANESDQAAAREGGEAVGGITGGAPAAAPPAEEEAYVAAGRAKQEQVETADARGARADAPPSLKKANAPRQAAAESKRTDGSRRGLPRERVPARVHPRGGAARAGGLAAVRRPPSRRPACGRRPRPFHRGRGGGVPPHRRPGGSRHRRARGPRLSRRRRRPAGLARARRLARARARPLDASCRGPPTRTSRLFRYPKAK